MVKLSFIIPAYNAHNTLAKCLKTVKAQNVNSEIVVVDDASTDDTREICKKFKVHYVRIKHAGAAAARNVGMEKAKGDFIALIDADTYLPKGWAAKALKNDFKKNDIVVAYSKVPPFLHNWIMSRYKKSRLMTPEVFDSAANGAVFPREKRALMKFDPMFIVGGEDNDVVLRGLKMGTKFYVDTDNFYEHYHIHSNKQTRIWNAIKKKFYFGYGDSLAFARHGSYSWEMRRKLKDFWPFLFVFPFFYAYMLVKNAMQGDLVEEEKQF